MVGVSATTSRATSRGHRLVGEPHIYAPPPLQLPLLTLGVLGAQTVWSIDMAFAPPYLLDLGLSKSAMAAVFIAGPLSGLIVQPLIGNLADNSTSKYGRRRPFLAVSTGICALSILLLGFASELAAWFTTTDTKAHRHLAIMIGVLSVYLMDFSVNAVTALDRALMIDVAATEDQAEANAWAARLSGVGSVLSFLIGNLELPNIFPRFLGTNQIQIVSVLVCIILVVTHALVLLRVDEQVLVAVRSATSRPSKKTQEFGLSAVFADLSRQARILPQPILEIFKIQFFAQIGWFPILFYSTVWVGEIYKADARLNGSKQSDHELFEKATRAGSYAFFWHAILSLITSILLPLVVPNPVHETHGHPVWFANSQIVGILRSLRDRCPELPFWWICGHLIFFVSMMGTYFAGLTQSVFLATWIVSAVGICFSLQNWVPFVLLSILIQTQQAKQVVDSTHAASSAPTRHTTRIGDDCQQSDEMTMALLGDSLRDEENNGRPLSRTSSYDSAPISNNRSRLQSRIDGDPDSDDEDQLNGTLSFGAPSLQEERSRRSSNYDADDDVERADDGLEGHDDAGAITLQAGSVLGLHNVAVVIPQFLVTALSSLIFAIMEPSSNVDQKTPSQDGSSGQVEASNGDALGLIFRLGGCCALVAGILAVRLVRRHGHDLRGY
ncbi:hypothetical protein NDA18_001350 [Ustilago nuda]|nr:hypothetical protein NDA18_001350 [Ustilago nuda]